MWDMKPDFLSSLTISTSYNARASGFQIPSLFWRIGTTNCANKFIRMAWFRNLNFWILDSLAIILKIFHLFAGKNLTWKFLWKNLEKFLEGSFSCSVLCPLIFNHSLSIFMRKGQDLWWFLLWVHGMEILSFSQKDFILTCETPFLIQFK